MHLKENIDCLDEFCKLNMADILLLQSESFQGGNLRTHQSTNSTILASDNQCNGIELGPRIFHMSYDRANIQKAILGSCIQSCREHSNIVRSEIIGNL